MNDAMQPNMDNGGRWDHIASEDETRAAIGDHTATIVEAPVIGCTFVISHKTLTMVRAGAMGGDTFSVEGGWVYANPFSLMLDAAEVKTVGRVAARR